MYAGVSKVTMTQLSKEKLSELEADVRRFFKKNIHEGHAVPFNLSHLELSPHVQAYLAVPFGAEEEDLNTIDNRFNEGLLSIGRKYGITLYLPSWMYEK